MSFLELRMANNELCVAMNREVEAEGAGASQVVRPLFLSAIKKVKGVLRKMVEGKTVGPDQIPIEKAKTQAKGVAPTRIASAGAAKERESGTDKEKATSSWGSIKKTDHKDGNIGDQVLQHHNKLKRKGSINMTGAAGKNYIVKEGSKMFAVKCKGLHSALNLLLALLENSYQQEELDKWFRINKVGPNFWPLSPSAQQLTITQTEDFQIDVASKSGFNPSQYGLKNFSFSPLSTMLQIPPIVNATLNATPSHPNDQLKYQLKLYFVGFLISTHIKHGYANVTGRVSPPNNPARLERNGSATPMKKLMNP
ncbi:Protein of unknown function DUF2053, membrane [Cynara cardunculus var. scolymus]|uniref:Uncharacterized protein n=1 Tax=Cynara cardunculus var. scolymus TaxID=59895 RepID=A0A103XWU8_CYNCS|nr:Protein of unknown function DUF2053, membrane [Cynara cardunculus var. scolymus]